MVQITTSKLDILHDTAKSATIVLAVADTCELTRMEKILTRHGYTVKSARTYSSAVQTIKETSPDLIILDARLPETGGIELCRHLKSQKRFKQTPILFISDIEAITEKSRAFQTGGADWMLKPIEEWELSVKVKTHLKLFFIVKSFASQDSRRETAEAKDTERELMKYCKELEATVKESTRQLAIAKEQSKAADIAKSIFLSHMSHELRTPLNAILGFSRLMKRDANLAEKQVENLDLILQSGEHLLNLINDVLAMAKSDTGLVTLDKRTIDLPQFIESIAVIFNNRAISHGLTFSLDMMPNMPRYVNCDERKLQLILISLLDNSVKHTVSGGIQLKVWSPSGDPEKQTDVSHINSGPIELFFEVRDSGKGITADKLESIFDPFYSEGAHGDEKTGTGLGLTISRNFAKLMGGDILAANRRCKGAHVTCHITVELASKLPEKVQYRVTGVDPDKAGLVILVVDDNGASRLLMSELLKDVGFNVIEAEDGRKAVALFFQWRPHLIFMDIRMPLMDGMEATKIIKATKEGKNIPVIALTAIASGQERRDAITAGCDALIRKPFEESELFEVMAKHLDLAFTLKRANQLPPPPPAPAHQSLRALAELPASMLEELKKSSLALDMEKINVCINDIQTDNPDLGEALGSLAKRFRFHDISKLAEEAMKIKN
jgi:signal transduction histidine kinase